MNIRETKKYLESSNFDWFAQGEYQTLVNDAGERIRYRRDVYRRGFPILDRLLDVVNVYIGIYYTNHNEKPLLSARIISSHRLLTEYWNSEPRLISVEDLLQEVLLKVREILDSYRDSILSRLKHLLIYGRHPKSVERALADIAYFKSIEWHPALEFLTSNKEKVLDCVVHMSILHDNIDEFLNTASSHIKRIDDDWPELNMRYISRLLSKPEKKQHVIKQLLIGLRDNQQIDVANQLRRLKELKVGWPELEIIEQAVSRKPILESHSINQMSEEEQLSRVFKNPPTIRFIRNPSERVQLAAVQINSWAIQYIKNPSEQVQLAAVSDYGSSVRFIRNPSEQVQLAAVSQDGWAIDFIKNPSLEVQIAAVKQDDRVIEDVENPSPELFANPEVKHAVVRGLLLSLKSGESIKSTLEYLTKHQVGWPELEKIKQVVYRTKIIESRDPNQMAEADQIEYVIANPLMISKIQNPTERVQLTAIHANEWAIRYIKNPSERVKLAAVTKSPFALEYIKNPSEQAQLAAVSLNPWVIEYIQNPSEEVQLAAVQQNGRVISFIENPTESTQLASVRREPLVIGDIDNPTERVKLAAVERNGYAIRYIKNPSERVQREVLINAPLAGITYITNIDPAVISTPEVKQSVMKHILTRIKYAKHRDNMDYDMKRFINRGFNYPELIYLLNAMTKKPINTADDK